MTMQFVLFKSNCQKWNLSHWETRVSLNSSLVERGRSLMNSQPHPFLHFLVRMKPTSTNVFIQVAKIVEITRGNIFAARRMFPSQISEAYPSPDWQYGDKHYHAKGWFRPIAFQGVLTLWHVTAPSATMKQTTPLCSSLLASIFQCWMNTFYTTLTSRAIKKQLCGPVHFHYACFFPYRWQYCT